MMLLEPFGYAYYIDIIANIDRSNQVRKLRNASIKPSRSRVSVYPFSATGPKYRPGRFSEKCLWAEISAEVWGLWHQL